MSVHDPQVGEKFLAQLGEVFEITGRVVRIRFTDLQEFVLRRTNTRQNG